MLENLYNQYNGNQPFIFGNKNQLSDDMLKAIRTDSPYVVDKITEYKKEIWNEALTFLGINNISIKKKERLTENESNENNELVNLNLQSMLAPRIEACRKFNELFGLTGTDKEISVRVRSDLENIIKMEQSVVSDYMDNGQIDKKENINKVKEEVVNNE
jgi:D-mannonate dehydratase